MPAGGVIHAPRMMEIQGASPVKQVAGEDFHKAFAASVLPVEHEGTDVSEARTEVDGISSSSTETQTDRETGKSAVASVANPAKPVTDHAEKIAKVAIAEVSAAAKDTVKAQKTVVVPHKEGKATVLAKVSGSGIEIQSILAAANPKPIAIAPTNTLPVEDESSSNQISAAKAASSYSVEMPASATKNVKDLPTTVLSAAAKLNTDEVQPDKRALYPRHRALYVSGQNAKSSERSLASTPASVTTNHVAGEIIRTDDIEKTTPFIPIAVQTWFTTQLSSGAERLSEVHAPVFPYTNLSGDSVAINENGPSLPVSMEGTARFNKFSAYGQSIADGHIFDPLAVDTSATETSVSVSETTKSAVDSASAIHRVANIRQPKDIASPTRELKIESTSLWFASYVANEGYRTPTADFLPLSSVESLDMASRSTSGAKNVVANGTKTAPVTSGIAKAFPLENKIGTAVSVSPSDEEQQNVSLPQKTTIHADIQRPTDAVDAKQPIEDVKPASSGTETVANRKPETNVLDVPSNLITTAALDGKIAPSASDIQVASIANLKSVSSDPSSSLSLSSSPSGLGVATSTTVDTGRTATLSSPSTAPIVHNQATGAASSRSFDLARIESRLSGSAIAEPHVSDVTHRTLAASPSTLEVGVRDADQGWVNIRAELSDAGDVTASLTAATSSWQEMLKGQLPALNAYLRHEQMAVTTTVVERSFAALANGLAGTAASHDSNASGGSHPYESAGAMSGSLSQGGQTTGGDGRQPAEEPGRTSLRSSGGDLENAVVGRTLSMTDGSNAIAGAQAAAAGENGHWLNVRA